MFLSFFFTICFSAVKFPPSLIPQPKSFILDDPDGSWTLSSKTVISCPSNVEGVLDVAKYFGKALRVSTGYSVNATQSSQKNSIKLTIDPSYKEESYKLVVQSESVEITASNSRGLFYGFQTLLQLLPPEIYSICTINGVSWVAPICTIEDEPRFQWRGVMLDVSRHFFGVDSIKLLLDAMAIQKLNVFHWHLSDDQGWRIEIKKYPNFHQMGSTSKYRPLPWHNDISDGIQYGPFYYTQEEVRDVVQYAKRRQITIVPEIEMPGHALGGLAGYPEISCTGGPFETLSDFGGTIEVYCPGNDKTLEILQGVIDEIVELFESEYIHIGGDECVKTRWQSCSKCQQRMKDQGLSSFDQLQSWFIQQMSNYLESKGRHLIGWDEIIDGGLADKAAVMGWRGIEGAKRAAEKGHNVVMASNSHLYFDHNQFPCDDCYQYICCLKTLFTCYDFNPTGGIDNQYHKYILGVEGSMWTEYVWGDDFDLHYKVFPRACAVAEIGWSQLDQKDWNRFLTNMVRAHTKRLDCIKICQAPITLCKIGYWAKENVTTQMSTLTWDVDGGVGSIGMYQVAFIMTSGSNALLVKNVKLLFDDQVVAKDESQGTASWEETGNNIFNLTTTVSGAEKKIKIQADVAAVDATATYGQVVLYYTSA